MYEEEDQENRIGSGERDAGDDINGLGHTYRMRRLLLPDLHEARLQRGTVREGAVERWEKFGQIAMEMGLMEITLKWKTGNAYRKKWFYLITSVGQPLFAEWVHGLLPPPQLVHATISLGPPDSRCFFSPCKWGTYLIPATIDGHEYPWGQLGRHEVGGITN